MMNHPLMGRTVRTLLLLGREYVQDGRFTICDGVVIYLFYVGLVFMSWLGMDCKVSWEGKWKMVKRLVNCKVIL